MDGIGCGSNAARSHARFGSPERSATRPSATRSPSGRRGACSTQGSAEKERALEINEGVASYTGVAAAAESAAGAVTRAIEILTACEGDHSFVRTFAYWTGPAYGLLLDGASPGWRQRIRGTDDFAALLAGALTVQPATDAAASASRYGGAEIRAAEEQRERGRQERLAELRRQFVDGPVLVIRGGGSGRFNSMGAVVIPDVGTVFFGPYRHNTDSGTLEAEKGVLLESSGSVRRVPAPVRRDDTTLVGDGWTFTAKPGWVIREGPRTRRLRSRPAAAMSGTRWRSRSCCSLSSRALCSVDDWPRRYAQPARQPAVTTDVVYGHKDGLTLTLDVHPFGSSQRCWRHLHRERRVAIEHGDGPDICPSGELSAYGFARWAT